MATKSSFRASRCFFVKTKGVLPGSSGEEQELFKVIFASEAEPMLMDMFCNLRKCQGLRALDLHFEFDWGPASKLAKEVGRLAFGKGQGKGKKAGTRGLFK